MAWIGLSGTVSVSADGSTVATTFEWEVPGGLLPNQAVRWTETEGWVSLGSPPGGMLNNSNARAVSADGSVVVGRAPAASGYAEPFRWTPETGMVALGALPGSTYGEAMAVSADGTVVVGESNRPGVPGAFRWTEDLGMVDLGIPGASGASANGSVVVGNAGDQAYRWTAAEGALLLGNLPGGDFSSATAVSGNGGVVFGYSMVSPWGPQAFRWTRRDGMVALGPSENPWAFDYPWAASADGSVVVGGDLPNGAARIWDRVHGTRVLAEVLVENGVDMTGWHLGPATGVSADGRTIVGRGCPPQSCFGDRPWIAVLPSLPPPPTACSDGADNDGDGFVDLDDPGCPVSEATIEDPPCDDGFDNDGDGLVDFDDPVCDPQWLYESLPRPACGVGFELAAALPLLAWLRARKRAPGAQPSRSAAARRSASTCA
jgi:probable HAF family extracellular repeat protein